MVTDPQTHTHKQTDRTDYNTLCRSVIRDRETEAARDLTAIVIAMLHSVTVSIGEDSIGVLMVIFFVNDDVKSCKHGPFTVARDPLKLLLLLLLLYAYSTGLRYPK